MGDVEQLDQINNTSEKTLEKLREKERIKQIALERKQHHRGTTTQPPIPLLYQERFAKSDSALPEVKEEIHFPFRNALSAGGGMKELAGQRDTLGDEFSSVINNPMMREYFRRFLIRSVSSEEHLRFLFEIRKYNSQKDVEERFDTLDTIVNKFVRIGCKDQVNLSSTVRTDILKKWKEIEEGSLDLLGDELLEEAYYYVFILLRDDSFPKFMNSSEFAEMKRINASNNLTSISTSAPSLGKPDAPQFLCSSAPTILSTNSKSNGALDLLQPPYAVTEKKKKGGFWPFRKDAK